MLTREELEAREAQTLAPYAQRSAESRGREHPEPEHPYRPRYARDRDRIIHSAAFRRLEYKTQVFANHEGDHYRTRLTHTLEVAQIARSVARALALNEDLAEALALAHDIGHGPFGHSGEAELARAMKDFGGFDHNTHGRRVVELLEQRYPGFPGLNLTWEVREGFLKHVTRYDRPLAPKPPAAGGPEAAEPSPSLEAQIVNAADEVAYDNHDLDDGLRSGMLHEEELAGLALWRRAGARRAAAYPGPLEPRLARTQTVRFLIDLMVTGIVAETERRIAAAGVGSAAAVRRRPTPLVGLPSDLAAEKTELEAYLLEHFYFHPLLRRKMEAAQRLLGELFAAYLADPRKMPEEHQRRFQDAAGEAGAAGAEAARACRQVVCDYVAGMTDRYALEEHRRLRGDRGPAELLR